MRRTVLRVTQAVAGVLLLSAPSAYAQLPSLSVDDVRALEQSSGGTWLLPVAVKLQTPPPPATDVTVNWTLVAGSATAGSDFVMANGTLTFSIFFMEVTKYIDVQIFGDSVDEWSPTLMQDEVFFIELSDAFGATIEKGRSTITLIDDDHSMPGVQFLAATSGGILTPETNELRWRIPGAQDQPDNVVVRWNTGPTCSFPTSFTGGVGGMSLGTPGPAGSLQTWTHSSTAGLQHCYSVFTIYSGTSTAEVARVKATPFDTNAGRVAWTYSPGCYPPCATPALAPPTVGSDAVYSVSNDGVLHAIQRGPSGGAWPTGWNPVALGKPTQGRSPVVPLNGESRLFLGTDGGGVHAVNGRYGNVIWSRSSVFAGAASPALPSLGGVQAQPAGIFRRFGGQNDMLLVGTNNGTGSNSFFALDPATGITQDSYADAAMGDVKGMAAVDYQGNRVFFLTASSTATLFALNLGPMGTPVLTRPSLLGGSPNPRGFGSGTSGSPVLRNDRIFFGDSGGQIYAVNILDGTSYAPMSTGDGQVKGFLWPDRRNNYLYFSTDTKVQGVPDQGGSFGTRWEVPLSSPSMVLQKPGSDYLYVGDGNGKLLQIDVRDRSYVALPLEGLGVQIGSPSLDGTHNLVVVGSATGTIYAVRVATPY